MNELCEIYDILKTMQVTMGDHTFDWASYLKSKEQGVGKQKLDALLVMIAKKGYAEGIIVREYVNEPAPTVIVDRPRITMEGLEYLDENSAMKKAARIAAGIVDVIS